MIAKKQISLAKSAVIKKISLQHSHIKKTAQITTDKSSDFKSEINKFNKTKKSPKEFFLTLKTKIKEFDNRWLDRIEKSRLYQ